MKSRKNKSNQSSKIYSNPNALSICLDNDNYHQKMWREKQEQPKNAQQKKRIDKILQCIIKQRMFGNLIKQKSRIPINITQMQHNNLAQSQIYHIIDSNQLKCLRQDSRKQHSLKYINERKMNRKKNQKYTIDLSNTIDIHSRHTSNKSKIYKYKHQRPSINSNYNIKTHPIPSTQLFSIAKIPQFSKYFKKLCHNEKSMVYQLRISRQYLYQQCQGIMAKQIMESFLFFFNFPPSNQSYSYRQYCNWIEKVINSPLKDIQYFIFRLLDQSKNGIVTITDLFQLMMYFPNNEYIQQQLYLINDQISKLNKQRQNDPLIEIKPSIQQVLIVNHNLKLDQMKQLLRQSNNDFKTINCVRSTIYHQSVLSLQHDWKQRMKIDQIQTTQVQNRQKKSKAFLKKQGMRISDYMKLYQGRKSRIFCQIMFLLTGHKIAETD